MANDTLCDLTDDLALLIDAGAEAGRIALGYFGSHNANEVWTKEGNSPVSQADYAVDNFLRDALLSARPDYGWLSEETDDTDRRAAERSAARRTFVVDPIDGTRGFIEGRNEWCISVAIVEEGRPVAGVLECPAMERRLVASATGNAELNGSPLAPLSGTAIRSVTASRKLNDLIEERYANELEVRAFIPSLAYRIAMVATGEIDAALARPGARDWDIAAAEIILERAGGKLTDLHGTRRQYNQKGLRSSSLLASGNFSHDRLLELANSGGFLH